MQRTFHFDFLGLVWSNTSHTGDLGLFKMKIVLVSYLRFEIFFSSLHFESFADFSGTGTQRFVIKSSTTRPQIMTMSLPKRIYS